MAPKAVCEAHGLMEGTLSRVQDNTENISKDLTKNTVAIAKIETTFSAFDENFSAFREENERHQSAQSERLDRLFALIQAQEKRRRVRPVHVVAVITSLFASVGVILSAYITRGPGK